jgi:putative ABC transport system ATP-binding protein
MLSITELRHANGGSVDLGPVTLEVEGGTCVAIMGASGSGKSLLLRAIADLDVSEGAVSLEGVERRSITAPGWRSRVGYLAAEPGWWAETVGEHFLDWPRSRETIARLGFVEDCGAWPVQRLSTGERQRLGLARILEREPRTLLLDEPTGGLDSASEIIVETLLRERLDAGSCCLMVTHDAGQMRRLATLGYELTAGRLRQVWSS